MKRVKAVHDRDGRAAGPGAKGSGFSFAALFTLALVVFVGLVVWRPVASAAPAPHEPGPLVSTPAPRVLLIASYDKDLPSQRHLEEGLAGALAAAPGPAPLLFFEYLDASRLDLARQREALTAYLQARYGAAGITTLVATSTQAADYLADEPGLLPQARRLFADVPQSMLPRIRARQPQAGVISLQSNYPAALREVMRLAHPRRLVVVGETRDDAARNRLALFRRAAVEVLPLDVPVEYWLDQPLLRLQQHAAALEPGAVLYYLLQFSDGEGRLVTPYEVAQRLAAAAAVPMFSQWETLVGSGIVGGYSTSHRLIGAQVGHALMASPGGAATTASPAESAGMRPVYDWRALRRWGLDGAPLPAGHLVLFREPGLLQQHRVAIVATACVLAGLVGMLALLLSAQRALRRTLDELAQQRGHLAERVAERTAQLDERVSELAQRNEELMRVKTQLALLANTDGLTGLANRRHFDEVLAHELRRLQRSGGELSLLMLDVDHFKAFNDQYGHPEGDRCLQALAGVLAGLCRRPADLAARFGGEEFVLVLPDTPLAGAQARALQLQQALARLAIAHAASPVSTQVTVSIGVLAARGDPAMDAPTLLAQVDALLYQAKSQGRNSIVIGVAETQPASAPAPLN